MITSGPHRLDRDDEAAVGETQSCLRITPSASSRSGKPTGSRTGPSAHQTSIGAAPSSTSWTCFPTPAAAGLHVGHPEGYTATDILCRYKRMRGFNVLHPMGWDAFGLPAEQYAVQTNTHPRITTQANIDTFRRQIKSLGFSYDWDREVDTTDPGYYKWTQWIFLKIFDTWYDPEFVWTDPQGGNGPGKGRPIAELPIPPGIADPDAYRDSKRLAYRALVPVNWCPALGTVLANEEVIDGKSERGGFPVVRMPLTQWMLRITAYAERLVDDLEAVDWPRPIKDMQRNWVGRSEGAEVDFPILLDDDLASWEVRRQSEGFRESPSDDVIRVYTTRPDTLFGATYMVLAPEHPLVEPGHDARAPRARSPATASRPPARATSTAPTWPRPRPASSPVGTPINPVTGKPIPIWIADYVLMGYGTGAIMAVPGHDERDFEFAKAFDLPIVAVVMPPDDWLKAHRGDSPDASDVEPVAQSYSEIPVPSRRPTATRGSRSSRRTRSSASPACRPPRPRTPSRPGWPSRGWAAERSTTSSATGSSRASGTGASPFPSFSTTNDQVQPVPESELPVLLPDLDDFKPTGKPEPPLSKASEWVRYSDALPPRDQHHAPVGRVVLVLSPLPGSQERRAGLGPGEGEVLDAG